MFKCKECGSEYDIKPDFCDCGNDTFDEIITKSSTPVNQVKISDVVRQEEQDEENVYVNSLAKKQEAFSMLVFLVCIIVSFVVLFFVGNPSSESQKTATKSDTEKTQQSVNIPTIDSIWDNSMAGVINNEKTKPNKISKPVQQAEKPEAKPQNQIAQNIQQFLQSGSQQPQSRPIETKTQSPARQKVQTQPQQSVSSKVKQTATVAQKTPSPQKTVSTKTQVSNPAPMIPAKTQAIANGQKTTANATSSIKQPTKTSQSNTVKPVQTASVPTQKTTAQPAKQVSTSQNTTVASTHVSTTIRPKATVDTQALKKELDNYKVGLRNTIGRKIDFANVLGDGDCTVSFKVASNGKLTNRAFAKQSSNVTLNDAVYSAVMSTPSYNPPPSAYNNETMNLHIKFYNGNFDISLY